MKIQLLVSLLIVSVIVAQEAQIPVAVPSEHKDTVKRVENNDNSTVATSDVVVDEKAIQSSQALLVEEKKEETVLQETPWTVVSTAPEVLQPKLSEEKEAVSQVLDTQSTAENNDNDLEEDAAF